MKLTREQLAFLADLRKGMASRQRHRMLASLDRRYEPTWCVGMTVRLLTQHSLPGAVIPNTATSNPPCSVSGEMVYVATVLT